MMNRSILLAVAAAFLMAGCGDSTEPLVPTTLEVDRMDLQMDVDDTATVIATVRDQHGAAFDQVPDGFGVAWSASNPAVARVEGGTVTAVGPGSATVTATAGSLEPVHVAVEVAEDLVDLTGSIEFDYSGDRTGSFSISSTFRLHPETGPDEAEWVVTFFDAGHGEHGSHDVLAERHRADGLFDLVWFWVEGVVAEPGTHPADDGLFFIGFDADDETAEAAYIVEDGTVVFTAFDNGQIQGTFELDMEGFDEAILNITAGAFDAPLVALTGEAAASPAGLPGFAHGTRVGGAPLPRAVQRERLLDVLRRHRTAAGGR